MSRSIWVVVTIVAALVSGADPARAAGTIPLTYESSFAVGGPDGIALNPATGTLFVGLTSTNSWVVEITTSGTELRRWRSGLYGITGLAFLPNGNLLLAARSQLAIQGGNNVVEFTTSGAIVPGGVAFNSNLFGAGDHGDIVYNPFTGTIFLTSDDFQRVYEVALNGTLLRSFSTSALPISNSTETLRIREPEGLTYNPLNGNLWITDDYDIREADRQTPGTGSVYEVTPDGVVVASFDFKPTGLGDAEGIAIDPVNRIVYVAFDDESQIGVFSWHPALLSEPIVLADFGSSPAVAVGTGPDASAVFAWRGAGGRIATRVRSGEGALGPIQILSTTGGHDPQVAVDRDGNAIFTWRGGNGQVYVRARSEAGVLDPEETISLSRRAHAPQVAVDIDGDAVVTWTETIPQTSPAQFRLRIRKRSAAGIWSQIKTLASGRITPETRLAVDHNGNAVATWEQFHATEPESRIYTRTRSAAGVLSETRALTEVGGRAFAPRVALDGAGNAIFVWVRCNADCRVQTRTRSAAGVLSPVQRLSGTGGDAALSPDVAIDTEGNAVFVWVYSKGTTDQVQARARSAAGVLSAIQKLSNTWATHARVALDAQGNAAFVWRRESNGRIQTRRRSAAGVLDPLQNVSTNGAGAPGVAVDIDGNTIIVYAHTSSLDIIAHVGQ